MSRIFSRTVLALFAAVFAGLLLYSLTTGSGQAIATLPRIMAYLVLPGFVLLMCVSALRLSADLQLSAAIILLSGAAAVYAAEGYLWLTQDSASTLADDRARARLEALQAYRQSGIEAQPAISAALLLGMLWDRPPGSVASPLRVEGKQLLPLSGISQTRTVWCYDGSETLSYLSDRYGFLNPDPVWSMPRIQIAAVGDSFAQGHCSPPGSEFMSLIRQQHPATLNLGMQGNGPLMELATIREFLPDHRPAVVLWVYYEGNDLSDLRRDAANPILRAYLDRDFSQGLRQDFPRIESSLTELLETKIRKTRQRLDGNAPPPSVPLPSSTARFIVLERLRQTFGVLNDVDYDFDLFEQVLAQARTETSAWGGTMYFVYVPDANFRRLRWRRPELDYTRDRVLDILDSLDIPVIDLQPAMQAEGSLMRFYSPYHQHLNREGQAFVAREILERLNADRVLEKHPELPAEPGRARTE